MKSDKTLDKTIKIAEEKVSNDVTCKGILRNKEVLAMLVKEYMIELQEYDVKELAEKYIQGEPHLQRAKTNISSDVKDFEEIAWLPPNHDTIKEIANSYDVGFSMVVPKTKELIKVYVNVDTENHFDKGYVLFRSIVYRNNEMVPALDAEDFEAIEHITTGRVYGVWIYTNPPEEREYTVTEFPLLKVVTKDNVEENVQILSAVLVALGKLDCEYGYDSDLLTLLEIVFSTDIDLEEKKKLLEERFSAEIVRAFEEEVAYVSNLSQSAEEN
jgi:hypothetical protein